MAGGELLSADDERFELSEVVASHDFESCSFDRSDNHPQLSNEKQDQLKHEIAEVTSILLDKYFNNRHVQA